jgi:hypothetical protein
MEKSSAELIAQLRAICGREFVLTDRGELATYQSDGLVHLRRLGRPLPVLHPIELLARSLSAP